MIDIRDICLFEPFLSKGLYKYSCDIRELFCHVKMGICIFEKTTKIKSYKTVSKFTHQPWWIFQNYLIHDTIKKKNYFMGYRNMKIDEKMVDIIDLQL